MTDPVQPQPAQIQQEQQPEAAHAPAPVPPKQKKTGVVVLTILVVLLLGAAGTFGALYFAEKKNSAETVQQKDREIADLTKKAKDADELATKASDERRKAENEMKAMTDCRDAARKVTEAGIAQDEQKITGAVLSMMSKC